MYSRIVIVKIRYPSHCWWLLAVFLLLVVSNRYAHAQHFEEKAYLSGFRAPDQFPVDSLWQYRPQNNTTPNKSTASGPRWTLVDAHFLRDTAGNRLPWSGNGWFRKQWVVPAQFRNRAIALRVRHFGASEIYLDGRLIHRYGTIGTTLANEKIYLSRMPIVIQLDSRPVHWLTVHYSNHRANLPAYGNEFRGFRLTFSYPTYNNPQVQGDLLSMMFSIMAVFSVFFGFIYLFYPARLASLFSSLSLATLAMLFFSVHLVNTLTEGDWLIWSSYAVATTSNVYEVMLLLNMYVLYYGRVPRFGWLLGGWIIVIIVLVWTMSPATVIIGPVTVLLTLEHLRVLVLGVRHRKNGFRILLFGFFVAHVLLFTVALDLFHWFPTYSFTLGILLLCNAMVTPLTLSLHLAWEFGTSNRELLTKLGQVEELSARNLRQEQEKQELLSTQNERLEKQVSERTEELQTTIKHLNITQNQLIQKEKLASLGELTAGIAHEIQNPLNFVNNFSELSTELIDEMNEEIEKGDTLEVKAIAEDLKQNLEKINHHGKRASSIVKGMLEHSRTGTGERQLTDINTLVDEYLRLAYHGFRAKDPTFNSDYELISDESLPKINVVPQEIGRVLLNLINNAFYAVNQRSTSVSLSGQQDCQPKVTVTTKTVDNQLEIQVHDNGTGMSKDVQAKIFQPFFTTKPTGQGTGLGLSLVYDIVTKGHGGEIECESVKGEGTTFVVKLPII